MGTVTCRPNAAGTEGTYWPSDTYNKASDQSDATYVYMTSHSAWMPCTLNFANPAHSGTITNVRIYVRSKYLTGSGSHIKTRVRVGGSTYDGSDNLPTSDWVNYYTDYASKPGGGSWDWSDIDSMEIGMNGYAISGSVQPAVAEVWLEITTNTAPNTPSTPTGSSPIKKNVSTQYSSSATDPDGDNVKLRFDWGDTTTSDSDYVASGTTVNMSHTWSVPGTYLVKTMAIDTYSAESGWSSTLSVLVVGGAPKAIPIGL